MRRESGNVIGWLWWQYNWCHCIFLMIWLNRGAVICIIYQGNYICRQRRSLCKPTFSIVWANGYLWRGGRCESDDVSVHLSEARLGGTERQRKSNFGLAAGFTVNVVMLITREEGKDALRTDAPRLSFLRPWLCNVAHVGSCRIAGDITSRYTTCNQSIALWHQISLQDWKMITLLFYSREVLDDP